jgi:hypothetical protein
MRKPVRRKKKQNQATISFLVFEQLAKKVSFEFCLQVELERNFFCCPF